jgi:hypothetical protein
MNTLTFWNRAPRALRPLLLVAALVIAGALGACGGESEEDATQEIEDVIIGYGESDGAAACDFLSASALDQLGGESGCSRQFEGVPPAELEVGEVEIDDDTATAQVTNTGEEGSDFELELVDEDGEWKISVFPGLETIAPAEAPPPAEETTTPEEPTTTESEDDTTTEDGATTEEETTTEEE